jgi:hypothetical protein
LERKKNRELPMDTGYPEGVVQDFIEEFEAEWGVRVPRTDALLMMCLFDGLAILLEKYGADEDAYMPFQMMPGRRGR